MLGIYRPEFARWNFILAKKKWYKVFFDNNHRRNIKQKTRQLRGGHRNYVTWRNFWEWNEEKKENLIAQDLEPSLREKASHLLIITPDVATRTKSSILLIELNQIKLNRTIRFD